MKAIMSALFFLVALSSTNTFADEPNPFAPLGLKQACVEKIFTASRARCNLDSKHDPSREHGCMFWGELEIKRNTATKAYFSIDFTVTDAVVYEVPVYVTDKATCQYKLYPSEN